MADETAADGQPDDDNDHNNDGKNNELHFHVLKPHLAPELSSGTLEIVSLRR